MKTRFALSFGPPRRRRVLTLSLATAAVSAGSPVEERQATMKAVGQSMKEGSALTSAFDAAKAKTTMDSVAGAAKKLKGLYPADSGADPKAAADPKIWQNKADFDKRWPRWARRHARPARPPRRTPTSFKTSFKAVGDTCKACHDAYRMKKKPA